ncbi:hypothetical protein DHEL01_v201010 [Diaporthe helianthi]|uniref:Uncharacterized protein n=1 Tax=Diaporthe helianthi TaxID=158607 RepID=A0A2P5IDM7_DIAHE|nr:hypothetical protein DHEL01_v201010 [Diaporthe helianthi]
MSSSLLLSNGGAAESTCPARGWKSWAKRLILSAVKDHIGPPGLVFYEAKAMISVGRDQVKGSACRSRMQVTAIWPRWPTKLLMAAVLQQSVKATPFHMLLQTLLQHAIFDGKEPTSLI